MDDIRAKRLAKLGTQSNASSTSTAATNSPTSSTNGTPLSLNSTDAGSSTILSNPTNATQEKIEHGTITRNTPKSTEDILKEWINNEYEEILSVTLNSESTKPNLVFMESTFTELVEDNQDPVFTKDTIDRVIIENLTEHGVENPFRYLNDSWTKVQTSKRLILAKDPLKPQKLDLLNEIERLTSSYGLVAFQISDMFINCDLVKMIEDIIYNENSYAGYLNEIVRKANEEETLLDFLNTFVPQLVQIVSKLTMDDQKYPLILNIFQLLLNEKSVAAIFTQINGFRIKNPKQDPVHFENSTILGPIFKLSPLDPQVAIKNFDRSVDKSGIEIRRIGDSLSSEHKVTIDRLFFITNKIIRGSEQSRKDLLKYFAIIADSNKLRRGDYSDFRKLSSNAFMTNISLVLVRMCQPFLDSSYSKIDKIDISYFSKKGKSMELTDDTRMNSTNAEGNAYFDKTATDETPNFISDCFFLTTAFLHYGIGGNFSYDTKLRSQLENLEWNVDKLKNSNINGPMARFQQLQLEKLERDLANLKSIKDALTSFFINTDLQNEIFDFVAGASCFLIRAIDPTHSFPQAMVKLPLIPDVIGVENADNTEYFREKAPNPFKYYPEYIIEGLINFCHHSTKYASSPLRRSQRLRTFIEFAVTFLRCPELIGNPHLKSKLVEVLSLGTMSSTTSSNGVIVAIVRTGLLDIFDSDELVMNNLLYALLDFYVVVEKTGSSSQFYDKFNTRYHISMILEQIWSNPFYKNQLLYQSEHNEEFFIRFVARMLNDLTYLLDESIRELAEIHSIQHELEARSKGQEPTLEGTDEELANKLDSIERHVKSNVGLTNRSLVLFRSITADLPHAFTKPEIIDRLAGMLDYNLDALVGPKCSELKVKDPEKYGFKPRELLVSIVEVFVNLSGQPEFVKSVSQDGRSFKLSIFQRAADIIAKFHLLSPDILEVLIKFANEAEKLRLDTEAEELELGDVPDEFLDPLMYTLMQNPVILPSSKISIDLATIKSHLLSDSTDPFNRMPLKLEDVVEDVDLKKKIEEWKANARANNK